jgi:NAD(P)H-nitrite reductase large subunit
MAGRRTAYKGSLSRNVIRIFGMDVMTAGLITPPEAEGFDILNVRDSRAKTYRKLVFRGDRLVGMVMVNGIEQGGLLMSLIQSETPVRAPREALLKSGFNFKQLMQV